MSELKHVSLNGLRTFLKPLMRIINKKAETWNDLKEKPFDSTLEEVKLADNVSITSNNQYISLDTSSPIIIGQEYTVVYDDVTYECVGYDGQGVPAIGDLSIVFGSSDGFPESIEAPFLIVSFDTNTQLYFKTIDSTNHTLTIIAKEETIKKLDGKYVDIELPEGILTQDNYLETTAGMQVGDNGEVFNNYGANSAGYMAHAEGSGTYADGMYSHAEGQGTHASGSHSHAEGYFSNAYGDYSHAEGQYSRADGTGAHAESNSSAYGTNSHAECGGKAYGMYSHAQGYQSFALGYGSYAEGDTSIAVGGKSHCEGLGYGLGTFYLYGEQGSTVFKISHQSPYLNFTGLTLVTEDGECYNIIQSERTNYGGGHYSYNITLDSSPSNISTDKATIAIIPFSGAFGDYSHVEGYYNSAIGEGSHAEGGTKETSITLDSSSNNVYKIYELKESIPKIGDKIITKSHPVQAETITDVDLINKKITLSNKLKDFTGTLSCELYKQNRAEGKFSHIEGNGTVSIGKYGHAEGSETLVNAEGAHAEGRNTIANGIYSHAEGMSTIASGKNQHVQGKLNIEDTENKYAHIVGNGTSKTEYPFNSKYIHSNTDEDIFTENRSNAHTLDWNGNAWFAGEVYVGGSGQDDATANKLAKQKDVNSIKNTLASLQSSFALVDQINGYTYLISMRNGELISSIGTKYIKITTPPIKTSYMDGDIFDPTGMTVSAIAYDDSIKEITSFTYSEIPLIEGDSYVEITYIEGGLKYTCSVEITTEAFDPAVALIDFNYTDNSNGTYTLTSWKGTYNGESSTELIIPNNAYIVL